MQRIIQPQISVALSLRNCALKENVYNYIKQLQWFLRIKWELGSEGSEVRERILAAFIYLQLVNRHKGTHN